MNGNSAATADTIYTGGNIITVNDTQPTAEALAVKDGRILAVGTAEEVLKTPGSRSSRAGCTYNWRLGRKPTPEWSERVGF
jgi:hypothetical protein